MCENELSEIFLATSTIPKRGISGVYALINNNTRQTYIGSSKNLRGRLITHKTRLLNKKYINRLLIDDFHKHPEALEFCIIEETAEGRLLEREQFWITFYQSHLPEFGYNRSPTAGSCAGMKQTPEHIENAHKKLRGRKAKPFTQEHRYRMATAKLGKTNPSRIRSVVQLNSNGEEIGRFESMTVAAHAIGGSSAKSQTISRACSGVLNTAYGYKWQYA